MSAHAALSRAEATARTQQLREALGLPPSIKRSLRIVGIGAGVGCVKLALFHTAGSPETTITTTPSPHLRPGAQYL